MNDQDMDDENLPIPTEACMVLVLGETGAGKSYFIKKLTENPSVIVGHGLESCTQHSQAFETQIGGTNLLLIDTPGFNDSVRSDAQVVMEIATSLAVQAAMGVRLLGIIYVFDISGTRMTNSLKRELEILRLIAGPRNYQHILLVTTKWGDVSQKRAFEIRQYSLEAEYWDDLIQGKAGVHQFDGTAQSARSIVAQLNFKDTATLDLQKEMAKNIPFLQTKVGSFTTQSRIETQRRLDDALGVPNVNIASNDTLRHRYANSRSASSTVVELETSLQRSKSDKLKMNVLLDDQVKQWIQEAVKEEKQKTKKKPTATKAVNWVLGAAVKFFSKFDKDADQYVVVQR